MQLQGDLLLVRKSLCGEAIPMITGLAVEEKPASGPRPGLILRRAGIDTLWDMAKVCGSTEEAIRQANGLSEDPAPERMLLIPVI